MKNKTLIALTISTIILLVSIHALSSSGTQPETQTNDTTADWLHGWPYRKAHNITGTTAGTQTNYPILLIVHYDNGYDTGGEVYLSGKCRTDFGDIRFTDSAGTNSLSYYMQQKVNSVYATFWIKASYIPASPDQTTIYIYYGNSTATTTSNRDLTLSLFDGFEDGTNQAWHKSWLSYVTTDGVTTNAYQGTYSRTAGRNYGSSTTGQGHFYERLYKTLYLTPGTYHIEGAARFDENDIYRIPQRTRLYINEISLDEENYPATNWKLLQGNFTLQESNTIEISIEFHLLISSSLTIGAENYIMDSLLIRKWSNPEPTHGTWTPETAWTGPPLGDVNGDGKVDVQDLYMLAKDYGKQYP